MSLIDFISTNTTEGRVVTREDLERSFRAVLEQPPHPCSLGRHVVSPAALRCGYGLCANCGRPVGEWPK